MKEHSPDNALYTWLLPFIMQLRGRGLPVTPDTHIKLVKVLDTLGDKIVDHNVLLDYVIPILAQNTLHVTIIKDEFSRFLELDASQELNTSNDPVVINHHHKRTRWIVGTIVALLVGCLVYFLIPDKHPPVTAAYQTHINPQNLDIVFDALPEYKYYADTNQLIYNWDFGDGTKLTGGALTTHTYQHTGLYKTSLQISAKDDELTIAKSMAQLELSVCKPQILIDPSIPTQADSGTEMMFTLTYAKEFPPATENIWSVNGQETATNTDTFYHTFTQTGMQLVQYAERDSAVLKGCTVTADKPVYIKAPREIDLNIVQAGKQLSPPWKRNVLVVILLLLIAVAGVAGYILLKRIGRKSKNKTDETKSILEEFKGDGEPFEIPFVRHDELIDDEPDLYRLAKKYNHRIDDNEYYLNVHQTISATIRAEGFIQPMYSHRTVPAEYLVLIDKTKTDNQQVRLFQYLIRKLAGNDVHIEQYSFHQDPETCYSDIYPEGISIMRLHDLYPRHSLVLFSNGYCLLDKYYPSPVDILVTQLKRWTKNVIFTPTPYNSWDHRERAISEALLLLPADIKGQIEFFELEEDGIVDYKEDISGLGVALDMNTIDFQSLAGVKQYLAGDVFLFQWLCALAIYPQLHWEIIVALGDALQKRNYRFKDVSYSALLKLVRIPWMQDKFFPPGLRLEMLKELEPVNEKIARETLIDVMNEAEQKLTKDSFAWEELYVQQTTDKAILYAHDPQDDQFKHYKEAFHTLKQLWQSDMMSDQSLVNYLSKNAGEGSWTTLIGNDFLSKDPSKSIAITDLFEERPVKEPKLLKYSGLGSLAVAALSLLILIFLYAAPGLIRDTKVNERLGLFIADSNALVPLHIKLAGGDCLNEAQMKKDSIEIYFKKGVDIFKISRADTVIRLPFSALVDSPAQISMNGVNANYQASADVVVTNDSLLVSANGCEVVQGCKTWNKARTKTIPLSLTGNWYDEALLDGTLPVCVPINFETDDIGGNRIERVSVCAIDPGFYRYTLSTDRGFKNIYFKSEGSARIGYAEEPTLYDNMQAALNSAYSPAIESKVNLQLTGQNAGDREGFPIGNNWHNDVAGNLIIHQNEVVYNNVAYKINTLASLTTTFKKKIFKARLSNSYDEKVLYLFSLSDNSVYASFMDPNTDAATNVNLNMGTLSRFGRGEDLTSLPDDLNEIWDNVKGNRIISINLKQNLIYYSTGDVNKYGTYKISKVMGNNTDGYRAICSSDQGYKVFFLKNINRLSFELSVCQAFYTNLNEAEKLSAAACDAYDNMTNFYLGNSQVVYLPMSASAGVPGNLAYSEKLKLDNRMKAAAKNASSEQVVASVYSSVGNGSSIMSQLRAYIARNGAEAYFIAENAARPRTAPFQRSYISFSTRAASSQSQSAKNNTNLELITSGRSVILGNIVLNTFVNKPDDKTLKLLNRIEKEMAARPRATIEINAYTEDINNQVFNTNMKAIRYEFARRKITVSKSNNFKVTKGSGEFGNAGATGIIQIVGYGF